MTTKRSVLDKKAITALTSKLCKMTCNDFVFDNQDESRIRLKCPKKRCTFSVYATLNQDGLWEIRSIVTHVTTLNAKVAGESIAVEALHRIL